MYTSFSSVQLLSHVWLSATPWTAAHQVSLSITNSWSLLKLMSIESVMPSYHLMLCRPLLLLLQSFPASGSFQMSQFFASGGQSIRISASASVLPVTTQDWFPLVWTGIHHYVYINIVHYQAKWCKIILLPIFDFLCFMESFFKFNFYFILEYSWFTVSH